MAQRRSLSEGLRTEPAVDRSLEKSFVYQNNPAAEAPKPSPAVASASVPERARLTTRIRADLAGALKRATLERKLANVTPNAVQEILEEALEPWLKTNGYLN
jgi:hypothetical protein